MTPRDVSGALRVVPSGRPVTDRTTTRVHPHGATRIRPARRSDVQRILDLMAPQVAAGNLLPRSRDDVLARLPEFLVLSRGPGGDGAIPLLGAGALHRYGPGLAEVRSLAVASGHEGRGLGRRLLAALVRRARAEGVGRLIALTRVPGFFEKSGFERSSLDALPEKVSRDCRFCPRQDSCDEIAMVLRPGPERAERSGATRGEG